MLCMRCGSRSHKMDHCPDVVIRKQIQQQQLGDSSANFFCSSSYELLAEELNAHIQPCFCLDSDDC